MNADNLEVGKVYCDGKRHFTVSEACPVRRKTTGEIIAESTPETIAENAAFITDVLRRL